MPSNSTPPQSPEKRLSSSRVRKEICLLEEAISGSVGMNSELLLPLHPPATINIKIVQTVSKKGVFTCFMITHCSYLNLICQSGVSVK